MAEREDLARRLAVTDAQPLEDAEDALRAGPGEQPGRQRRAQDPATRVRAAMAGPTISSQAEYTSRYLSLWLRPLASR